MKLTLRPLPDLGFQVEGDKASFDERLNWLPESDALQNGDGLFYEFPFGITTVRKGQKEVLLSEELEARRRAAWKQPHPPAIQICLRRALECRQRLDSSPGLSQSALARELGVSRVRLTNLLHLLKLHPEVQRRILGMPATTARRSSLSEDRLRVIALRTPRDSQLSEFERLSRLSKASKEVAA
jgi:hypothetical protein